VSITGHATDADDDAIKSWRWRVASAPAGSTCVSQPSPCLAGATSQTVTFTPPVKGTYALELIVNDGVEDSLPSTAVVRGPNRSPVASTPAALTVRTGGLLTLDGSASADPDAGDVLAYKWEQVGAGDPVQIQNATSAVATVLAPTRGQQLFFRLIVSDGLASSAPAIVAVRVNAAPRANANPSGASVDTAPGTPLRITGSGSDPDGDPIVSYKWTVSGAPAGSACLGVSQPCLSAAAAGSVTFVAPAAGNYVLSLVVSDGLLDSLPSDVAVQANSGAPTAVALASQHVVSSGQPVQLDGTSSTDPDNDAIAAYTWAVQSKPGGATVIFSPHEHSPQPSVLLRGRGTYVLSLVVEDVTGAVSFAAFTTIDVLNSAPTAGAGADKAGANGSPVSLIATASDPDNDPLQYAWTMVDYPPGGLTSLTDADKAIVRFTPTRKTLRSDPALCLPGECYRLALLVSDGIANSAVDEVVVTSLNRPPTANAGPDQALVNNSTVRLDGSLSADPDGDPLTSYAWAFTSSPADDANGGVPVHVARGMTLDPVAGPSFLAPLNGRYVASLVVGDGLSTSAADTVTITISDTNQAPTLSLAKTTLITEEKTAYAGFGVVAADPELSQLEIHFERVLDSDPPAFPATVIYPYSPSSTDPAITAPAMPGLLTGAVLRNYADYDVVAIDAAGAGKASLPVRVRLWVAPGDNVYLSPGGADVASCGTVNVPCLGMRTAIGKLTVARPDLLLYEGTYTEIVQDNLPVALRSSSDYRGGRVPFTFARGQASKVWLYRNCCGENLPAVYANAVTGATVDNLDFGVLMNGAGALSKYYAFICDSCQATLTDVAFSIGRTTLGAATPDYRGVQVRGSAADVHATRLKVTVAEGTQVNLGVEVATGASFVLDQGQVDVTAATVTKENAALEVLTGGTAVVRRSVLRMTGSDTGVGDPTTGRFTAGAFLSGGNLTLENSVVYTTAGPESFGLLAITTGGAATLINSTLLGGSYTSGGGTGVRSDATVRVMNSLVQGFARGLNLATATSLGSLLFNNAFDNSGSALTLAACNGFNATLSALNGATGTTCNQSAAAWAGNLQGYCWLTNPAAADYTLITSLPNPCVDAGASSTPAGVAPGVDLGNQTRPQGTGIDIGADEGK
jgi:hypothetical protein